MCVCVCLRGSDREQRGIREREKERETEMKGGHRRQTAVAVIFSLAANTVTAMDEVRYKARHPPEVRRERAAQRILMAEPTALQGQYEYLSKRELELKMNVSHFTRTPKHGF